MHECVKRARYARNILHYCNEPYAHLFNLMPKRWQTYARDLHDNFGFTLGTAITDTFIDGCRNYILIRTDVNGERRCRSINVKVSNRGHIYLE